MGLLIDKYGYGDHFKGQTSNSYANLCPHAAQANLKVWPRLKLPMLKWKLSPRSKLP